MSKQFWGVIVVVILLFIGIFALTGSKSNNPSGKSGTTPTEHIEGEGKDHVTLVEYGDYQCPYCGQYNQQITFQFRNFPLTSLHPNAFAAARAAEAAGLQGKFWQMHDLLYEENDLDQENSSSSTWIPASDPTQYFDAYAQQLGLNVTQFKTDYASTKVDDLITADMSAGNKLNITGTPTFFLDGKQISVGESVSQFETLIKAAIAKSAGTSATTTPSTTSAGTTSQTQAK
jgi:protein-disulfide isomerase